MADCFILSSVETHASIAPQFAVVKEAGVLSALLSGSFCSGQRVINKCFQCDAIGLAMLEEGQHSAAHAGGVGGKRTNQRPIQFLRVGMSGACDEMVCLRVGTVCLPSHDDAMIISAR